MITFLTMWATMRLNAVIIIIVIKLLLAKSKLIIGSFKASSSTADLKLGSIWLNCEVHQLYLIWLVHLIGNAAVNIFLTGGTFGPDNVAISTAFQWLGRFDFVESLGRCTLVGNAHLDTTGFITPFRQFSDGSSRNYLLLRGGPTCSTSGASPSAFFWIQRITTLCMLILGWAARVNIKLSGNSLHWNGQCAG